MEMHEELKLNLSGLDEIEIDTLSEILKGTIDSLKALTQEDFEKGAYRKFVVKNVTKGSFIIEFWSYIVDNKDLIQYSFTAIGAFKAALEIKNLLKGKKPKEVIRSGNEVKIVNESGSHVIINQFIFDKVTTDDEVEKGINKIFKAIEKDDGHDGFKVDFKDEKGLNSSIQFEKEDMKELSKPLDLSPYQNQTADKLYDPIEVRLGKIDLLGDSKWTIIFGSSKELAEIADDKFLSEVKSGLYQFGTSTVMKVKLRIRYFVDENNQFDLNKKVTFTILEVYEVISNGYTQTNLEILDVH